jgi:23S rRNA (guanosine2251-2'-O)-methyltransferase
VENLIKGRQPVLEALRSDTPLEKVYTLFGTRGSGLQEIHQLARRRGVPVKEVDRKRFLELCPDEHAQGVIAVAATKEYVDIDDILRIAEDKGEKPFLLILDEIEDPHNIGALIRTAECAGVHGVILPRHHSATLNETVAKASAGASLHVPAAKVTNIATTLDELRSRGVWIIGTDMLATRSFDEVDYAEAIAVVVGNEGKGIRRLVKEKCDFLVRIPMYGKIGSLNASVAGGLVMFEAARGRHRNAEKTGKS